MTIMMTIEGQINTGGPNPPVEHLSDLAGLVLRTRSLLHEKRAEVAACQQILGAAAEQMQEWAATFAESGIQPPLPREVSARLRWWRRIWRERKEIQEVQVLLAEALPWLECYRDELILHEQH